MKKIDKYVAKTILASILLVLLVLVGLFTFFAFIDEIDDIGKQRYGLQQAIEYVLLETPGYIYELFPSAILLGTLVGLGALANNSELIVMRAAGLSIMRITLSALKIGLGLTIIVMLIGETLAPLSKQYAQNMRATAQSDLHQQQTVFKSWYGFWARDGHNFINIRTIYPNGRFGIISLYKFNEKQQLQEISYASTAYYNDEEWILENVERIKLTKQQITRQFFEKTAWKAILKPELIKLVVVRPNQLSIVGLHKYIKYLKQNGHRTKQYELAFWNRLSYPLITVTMIFIAIPFIFGSLRSVSIGQRVLVGALLGVGFHMLNQVTGNIGLVYGMYPILSAFLPPLLFLIIAVIMMRRIF
ncbi:MAG: LPS export ABC transporter permease LptG [Thiomargarita sp.]|nr:LPS export ABC transporter permease LptG [Thiomargarita sp.]